LLLSSKDQTVGSGTLKIGVFDSGLGGLTVVQAMKNSIKGADICYIADTKHAPYGEKTQEEILQYTFDITEYFIKIHQIDALVVACNTATTAAIKALRERYPQLIIVGTEPGVKPAITATQSGKIGILATPATLKSEKYQKLVKALAVDNEIMLFEQACPGLVEQIEQDLIDTEETRRMLEGWLCGMRESGVDTIVLGCTHYPLAAKMISVLMNHQVTLIHTGEAIAMRLLGLAEEKGHINKGELSLSLYATGPINEKFINKILHTSCKVQRLEKESI